MTDEEVRIGVSRCLLGEQVRFDGGHKRSAFVTETLAPFVRYVAVCPEVEMGMSTPREPIRLVRGKMVLVSPASRQMPTTRRTCGASPNSALQSSKNWTSMASS